MAEIKKKLKLRGYRQAPARDVLLRAFFRSRKPLSAKVLLLAFRNKKIGVNKTTIYRALEILEKEGMIEKVEMGDSQRWYESAHRQHHHHAVCENCNQVVDLEIPLKMKKELEKVMLKKEFSPKRHTIEFFGLCKQCQH